MNGMLHSSISSLCIEMPLRIGYNFDRNCIKGMDGLGNAIGCLQTFLFKLFIYMEFQSVCAACD